MRIRPEATKEFSLFMFAIALAVAVFYAALDKAHGHEIYTGVTGKDGQLCCGGSDCQATIYREEGSHFYFLTREKHWVEIPQDRITWLPVPGDQDVTTHNHAHLCYRDATSADKDFQTDDHGMQIHMYCAFIPPGAI